MSLRERDFVRHYLAGKPGVRGNATRAYIAAGYAPRAAAASARAEICHRWQNPVTTTPAAVAPSRRRLSARRRRGASEAERAFVRHFLTGKPGVRFNATSAVLAAGYRMTRRSARAHGAKLLARDSTQRLIEQYRRRADLSVERTLEEWRRLAFSDLRDFVSWDEHGVRLTPSDALEDDTAPAVAEVIEHRTTRTATRRTRAVGKEGEPGYVPPGEITTETVERNLRLKLHRKIDALVNLSKYLGLLKEHEPPTAAWSGLPKGFFAALILRDPSKLQGVPKELLELPSETAPAEPAVIARGEVEGS